MKRFQFSLETLLSLRKEKEQETRRALAGVVSVLTSIERKMERARALEIQAFRVSDVSVESLISNERLRLKSINDLRLLEKPRAEAVEKVQMAQQEYNEAHASRMAIDRIREKKLGEWKKERKLKELEVMNEIAGNRAKKNDPNGE